jgi:K+-transporting ATPase KdpF subunit
MDWTLSISLVVAVGLAFYLLAALLFPEKFS